MQSIQDLENIQETLFRKKILLSLVVPVLIVSLLWIVRFIEAEIGISLTYLGIYPHETEGLAGIFLSPFIHSDIKHLFNNTIPLLILGSALFYLYSDVAFRVFVIIWIGTGILVWFLGRPAWHIGASGIIYGLASFLFVSGVIRKYIRLMAVSLLVVFIYGSMVWGMFPVINHGISWESHMLGAVTGFVLAIIYRKRGPVMPVPEWMAADEDEDDGDNAYGLEDFSEQLNQEQE